MPAPSPLGLIALNEIGDETLRFVYVWLLDNDSGHDRPAEHRGVGLDRSGDACVLQATPRLVGSGCVCELGDGDEP